MKGWGLEAARSFNETKRKVRKRCYTSQTWCFSFFLYSLLSYSITLVCNTAGKKMTQIPLGTNKYGMAGMLLIIIIITIMEICKAPTLWLKAWNKHYMTHIMYIEMEMLSAIKQYIRKKKKLTHNVDKSLEALLFYYTFYTCTIYLFSFLYLLLSLSNALGLKQNKQK